MADRIVKPDSGNDLVLQNDDASAKIEINEAGTVVATPSIEVDNIKIDGNTITSENTNGNIAITPNGTGEVDISNVDIDSGTIDGTDVTVGAGKTLNVSAGTFTTSTAQNEAIVSDGVPANIVAYTSAGSAPSGWSEYTSARGRMIVGLPSGGTNEGTVGTAFTNVQDKSHAMAHDHTGTAHVHGVFYMDITAGTLRYNTGGRYGSTGGTFTADRGYPFNGNSDSGLGIPTTESVAPGNSGSTTVTATTSNLLAYIQLMAIKKD
jgi:hypothetical protein